MPTPPRGASSSRPTTSGSTAPLVVETPQNIADVKALLKVFKDLNGKITRVIESQAQMQQHLIDSQLCI